MRSARIERRAHFEPGDEILSEKISGLRRRRNKVSLTRMPDPATPPPETPAQRRPVCTIASWVAPALGGLVTFVVYQIAVAHRSGGDWLPGLGQLLAGTCVTGVVTFGVGLAALLRREENRWLALPPFLAGLVVVLYFAWSTLRYLLQ